MCIIQVKSSSCSMFCSATYLAINSSVTFPDGLPDHAAMHAMFPGLLLVTVSVVC